MKEYLKMSDVFPEGVLAYHGDEYNGWSIIERPEYGSIDESGDGGFEAKTADYVVHAINSHDELVEINIALLQALKSITQIDWRRTIAGLDRPTDFAERQAALHAFNSAVKIAKEAIKNIEEIK